MGNLTRLGREILIGIGYHLEFSGILTLDLDKNHEDKRYSFYQLMQKGNEKISFEKIYRLDTVWAVKCGNFATKDDANEALLSFLSNCLKDVGIDRGVEVSFNLSLSYLNTKESFRHMKENLDHSDIAIDYSLYEKDFHIAEHLEPVYPIVMSWNNNNWKRDSVF